jgi:hypothetical protein
VFFSKTAFFLLQNQKHLILAFTIFFKKITLLRLIRKWIAVRSIFAFFFAITVHSIMRPADTAGNLHRLSASSGRRLSLPHMGATSHE